MRLITPTFPFQQVEFRNPDGVMFIDRVNRRYVLCVQQETRLTNGTVYFSSLSTRTLYMVSMQQDCSPSGPRAVSFSCDAAVWLGKRRP